MKTLIADIIQAERFLAGELEPEDELLYQARILIDRDLATNVFYQRMLHRLLRFYHRKKLRRELDAIHDRLLNDPAKACFRTTVLKNFKA